MNDLISRSALMEYPLQRGKIMCHKARESQHFLNGVASVLEYAQNLPSIPAEVVRHGRWTESTYFDEPVTRCTAYGRGFAKDHKAKRFPYCPNCGAKMDGAAHD